MFTPKNSLIQMRVFPFSLFFLIFILSVLSLRFWTPSELYGQGLPEKQQSIADRYAQLEQVLFRMSEVSANTNPRRAALLKKVLLASKAKLIGLRMGQMAHLLEQKRLTETANGQEEIEKDLLELLRMLESENREQRREAEKERIKEFLRDLEELIHEERTVKMRTSQREAEQISPLEQEQKKVRTKTDLLRERFGEHESPGPDRSSQSNESRENDESDRPAPTDSDPDAPQKDKPAPLDIKEEEEQLKDQESDSPSMRALRKSLQRMKQAEQKLKASEKNDALEEQEEALAELQRVKAELEKILRQIREEELMQTLEKLEVRFKRMLKAEQSIRSRTAELSSESTKAGEAGQRQIQVLSGRAAADQQIVIADTDDALLLLREDGTAQAMAESLLQARFDMTEVQSRLEKTVLDSTTLAIEDIVITSLEEMLDAISLAVKEAEKRTKADPPSGEAEAGGEEVEPLIQLLSELRMIRSMQQRVNERTQRYETQIDQMKNDSKADFEALRQKVEELTRQQNRISRILHDLKIGKTR